MIREFIFTAVLQLAVLSSTACVAEERAAGDPAEMSRENWQEQVKASRERAEVLRRERRGWVSRGPTEEEIAEEASRRAFEDDSLLPGDIISTNRGVFRFQGSPDGSRKPTDFVRIR